MASGLKKLDGSEPPRLETEAPSKRIRPSLGLVDDDQPEKDARAAPGAEPELRPRPAGERSMPGEAPKVAKPPAAPEPDIETQARPGLLRRHPRLSIAGLIGVIAIAFTGYLYVDHISHFETTDDAFIAARRFAIAPEVAGYITAVPVTDNQHVAAHGVIARIDERDYRIALEQARAKLEDADAGIKKIDAQLEVQNAQIAADKAQLDRLNAALDFAGKEAVRYKGLADVHAGSVEKAEQTASELVQQHAAVENAQATLKVAERQVDSLKADHASAVAARTQAQSQLDKALLDLSYTTVTAAQSGRVVQLSAAVGEFAQPGTNLTMFVPDEIWVVANFKETQLDAMRPGQPVTLHIDAYPERAVLGHVASVQPGSGTAFSLLPAENATGNYVKIVQRVPVKIIIDNPPTDVALGPGMSVEPDVRTDASPSLYERLTGWL